jgi:phosphoserine phosphatase RsbU/P
MYDISKKIIDFLKIPFRSCLSKKLIFVLFISIFFIETILIIISLESQKKTFFLRLKEGSQKTIVLLVYKLDKNYTTEVSTRKFLVELQNLHQINPEILGGAIYSADGKLVSNFGESPALKFSKNNNALHDLQKGAYYDTAIKMDKMPISKRINRQIRNYTIILRHDASSLEKEAYDYILEMADSAIIIALFTIAIIRIALEPIVINPILKLRRDLIEAGKAIYTDQYPPKFYSTLFNRKDELGDVIVAFKNMFEQISEAIALRKQTETALQKSLKQLEQYSKKLNEELETGQQIQRNFLPSIENFQDFSATKSGWEINSFFKPARQLSGDFYDVFELPNGDLGLVIADVCDKGVGAALFMALFRSLIRIFSIKSKQESFLLANDINRITKNTTQKINTVNFNCLFALQVIFHTNDYVAKHHGELGMFATIFFGVLDPATGLLSYVNAGHEPLYIINSQGGVREVLEPTGPAVGIWLDRDFQMCQSHIKPGEILLGYTDGLTEARRDDGTFFTKEQLLSILDLPTNSLSVLLHKITTKVIAHIGEAEQFDDITLLAVRRKPLQK